MALTIDQVFREHIRFTGDDLPNEPVGAPLPIGDPQSAPHSPTKAEIREAFGPLENAVDDAEAILAEIETIRDIVAGYASDAVSQGFVPLYSSAVAVAALNIDASIGGLRTNGYTTAGDGGAAFYVRAGSSSAGSIVDGLGAHWRLASWPLNVKMYGAKGDGVTDDSVKLQIAFTAAAGQHLYIPSGIYNCVADNELALASGVTLMAYGATLNFSAAAEGLHVRIVGSVGSNIVVTTEANEGDSIIGLTSVSGLAEGDILRISSDALVRLDAIGGTTTQTIGEFVVIRAISGLNVTIHGRLDDDYLTADNAVVAKLVGHKNNVIAGLTVIGQGAGGDTSDIGISVHYAENLIIRDCKVIDCERNGIKIEQTYKFLCDNNEIRSAFDAADTLPSSLIRYGICPVGCTARGTISNNHITGGKHGIVFSEDSNPGVGRDIKIVNNTIIGTGHAAIATHETNTSFVIHGNTIIGCACGMNIRVRNGIITGNDIRDIPQDSSIGAAFYLSENAGDLLIANNRVVGCRFGVRMNDLPDLARPVDIIIRNNHFENINQHGVEIDQNENNLGMTGWVIEGNTFRNFAGDGIKLVGEFISPRIANNYCLCDTPPTGYGVRLGGTLKAFVQFNTFLGMVPVRLQPDTQTVPAVTRNPQLIGNAWDHTTAFLSNDSGTQIMRYGNSEVGDVEVTISAGIITVPTGARRIVVDTQSAAATDDLDTINGGDLGDLVVFQGASSSRDVTFKDGTGNLSLEGDFIASSIDDSITLANNGGGAWREIARSNNA